MVQSLDSLASLYQVMGQNVKAVPLLQEVAKALGKLNSLRPPKSTSSMSLEKEDSAGERALLELLGTT